MTTDELIATLARSPQAARPARFNLALIAAVIGGLVLGLIFLKFTFGFRPDIGVAAPIVALKAGLSALIATFAGGLAMSMAKPQAPGYGQGKRAAAPIVTLVFACLAVGAITLFSTTPAQRFEAFTGGGFPWCLVLIPVFGMPTALLLMWVVRDAAPTRLALAGASVGALSGGIGAIVYAMFCPIDSLAFVTIWYVAGIGVASVLGAFAGVRLLRW